MSVHHSNAATQAGFTQIPNVVMLRQDLKPLDKLVYGLLKHFAWRNHSAEAEPPMVEIMQALGVTEPTARASLRRLAKAPCLEGDDREETPRLLVVKRRGLGQANVYWINDPYREPPQEIDGSETKESFGQTERNRGSFLSRQDVEPKTKTLPRERAATVIEHLGGRRWRVASSREGEGPWTVDLDRMRCDCPAHVQDCRHVKAVLKAESEAADQATAVQQRLLREAVWNALADLYGEPPTDKLRRSRGVLANEIVEALRHDGVEEQPGTWANEVRARNAVLVRAWGSEHVTPGTLVKHWAQAGKMRHNGGASHPDVESDEERELRERRERYDQFG